jgi:hypothetical protein
MSSILSIQISCTDEQRALPVAQATKKQGQTGGCPHRISLSITCYAVMQHGAVSAHTPPSLNHNSVSAPPLITREITIVAAAAAAAAPGRRTSVFTVTGSEAE